LNEIVTHHRSFAAVLTTRFLAGPGPYGRDQTGFASAAIYALNEDEDDPDPLPLQNSISTNLNPVTPSPATFIASQNQRFQAEKSQVARAMSQEINKVAKSSDRYKLKGLKGCSCESSVRLSFTWVISGVLGVSSY